MKKLEANSMLQKVRSSFSVRRCWRGVSIILVHIYARGEVTAVERPKGALIHKRNRADGGISKRRLKMHDKFSKKDVQDRWLLDR